MSVDCGAFGPLSRQGGLQFNRGPHPFIPPLPRSRWDKVRCGSFLYSACILNYLPTYTLGLCPRPLQMELSSNKLEELPRPPNCHCDAQAQHVGDFGRPTLVQATFVHHCAVDKSWRCLYRCRFRVLLPLC
ncbi:hypothetical protein V6N13_001235 [Hibiscus sabdariffa]|uniref:Uncharacterized protein n=1 Tax=Hibiscus sabdariffa TaxID=183260 RepID=A0ABR2G7R4_9ROSI